MKTYGITVLGHDRPGIVANVTAALAEHGGNIEDSSMTLLRGHFAWTLVVALDGELDEVDRTIDSLRTDDLKISIVELPAEEEPQPATHWLTVHGTDRSGIVSAITAVVAAAGGNITDLTTRLAGELYVVGADVRLPAEANPDVLSDSLKTVAKELGVQVSLRPIEEDEF